MPAQGFGIVLDVDSGRFGGAQGVDAQQERQCPVVNRDGLGHLEKPDQLEPIQSLRAGLVMVHLGQPRVYRWVGGDETVDVREAEEPANAVHHGDH